MNANDPGHLALILGKVRSLAPLVQQHRDVMEAERRMPQVLFDALAEADLFRLWLPRGLGGPEFSPLEYFKIVEEAAALDGSIGWIVSNGAGMSRAGGYLPQAVSSAWFAEPSAFVVAATGRVGTAVPVAGGYRVTGRWPFGSGIHHATRFMGLCNTNQVEDHGTPHVICCYLAPDEVQVIDNWHVSGLRGTGSCDFEAHDVFVPAAHTHGYLEHKPTQPGLLYRIPAGCIFPMTVSAVPLGIASSALASFITLASTKVRGGTTQILRDRETVQATVGRARTILGSARAFFYETVTEVMTATDIGGEQMVQARVGFRAACTNVAESAVKVVDMLAATAGAAAIFETCILERCVRDAHAAAKHVAMSPNNYIVAGRVTLGLEPQ